MSGTVAIIVKIMPSSPSTNLEEIKNKSFDILKKEGGKNISSEEKPIAFGLKAIFLKFAWPEETSTEVIETKLSEIKNVSSATIEDYRRAFG
jgi:translation elongation factor aEF-1 beta